MRRRPALSVLVLSGLLLAPAAARAAERSALWKANCEKCHGADGAAQTDEGKMKGARNLTNGQWQKTISDTRMIRSITKGRDKMPAFGAVLTPEQIQDLVKEVRTLPAAK